MTYSRKESAASAFENAGQRKYLGNLTVHFVTTPSVYWQINLPYSGGLVPAFIYLQNCIVL